MRRIWGSAKMAGLDGEQVRDVCEQISKQRHVSALNDAQLLELAQDMSRRAGKSAPKPPRRPGSGQDIISPAQQKLIEDFWIQLAALRPLFAKAEYQAGFIKRLIGSTWPQKKWQASKIIEAQKRKLKEIGGRDVPRTPSNSGPQGTGKLKDSLGPGGGG